MQLRQCPKCSTQKPLHDFYERKSSTGGKYCYCRECSRAMYRDRYRNDPEYREKHQARRRRTNRGDQLRAKFNMSEADYYRMLEAQDGVCALCGTDKFGRSKSNHFVVDHCHVTGKVRGLLCHPCNIRVGSYERLMDTAGMDKLQKYLQSKKE